MVGSFVDGGGTRHNVEVAVAAAGVTRLLTGEDPFTNDHHDLDTISKFSSFNGLSTPQLTTECWQEYARPRHRRSAKGQLVFRYPSL